MDLDTFTACHTTVQTRSGPVAHADIGTGPVALFVHGVGTNGYLWHHVIDALSGERRCLAIDLPLHGRTPAEPGRDFSLGALADVLADFCEALGLTAVDLVANDTGGAVAQIFAARHPERLASLTLTNCDTHDNIPPEAFKPIIELAAAGAISASAADLMADMDLVREGGLGAGFEHPEKVSDETLRYYTAPVLGSAELAHEFERCLTSLTAEDLLAAEPALRKLEVPTLVIWGTGDIFFELKWAYWLRDTIPGVREVIEVEGAKLFFPAERPDDLVPHLRRHWAG